MVNYEEVGVHTPSIDAAIPILTRIVMMMDPIQHLRINLRDIRGMSNFGNHFF